MQKTIAQEMMEEFLQRQKQYDFIYRKNQIYERDNAQKLKPIQKYHKFRDAVQEANNRYIEQRKNKKMEEKRAHQSQITRRQQLKTENEKKKELSEEVLSLNFGLLLAILIPFLGLFGLMIWVTSQ